MLQLREDGDAGAESLYSAKVSGRSARFIGPADCNHYSCKPHFVQ